MGTRLPFAAGGVEVGVADAAEEDVDRDVDAGGSRRSKVKGASGEDLRLGGVGACGRGRGVRLGRGGWGSCRHGFLLMDHPVTIL